VQDDGFRDVPNQHLQNKVPHNTCIDLGSGLTEYSGYIQECPDVCVCVCVFCEGILGGYIQ